MSLKSVNQKETNRVELEIEVDAEKGELVIRRRDYACILCKKTEDLIEIKKGVLLCTKKCMQICIFIQLILTVKIP